MFAARDTSNSAKRIFKLLIFSKDIFCALVLNIMKRSCQPADQKHIHGLPKDLVGEILMRMPINDAVRTSILSKKWRYSWTELPRLIFDNSFYEGLIMKNKSKIILTIYQVLLLHGGPLDLFKLTVSNLKSGPEIDHFVLVVLQAGVKDFTLHISKGKRYELPSSIFVYSPQLESLNLRCCVLKLPIGFNGFSTLVNLKLSQFRVCGGSFSSLISHCPLLKILWFSSYVSSGVFDIVSPNLESFRFVGLFEFLSFTNTPKLATVHITSTLIDIGKNACLKVGNPSQYLLCGRLPVVEDLMVDYFYLKYMAANRSTISFVDDLCHLKKLYLSHICFGFLDEVSSAVSIVKNSKYLEKLSIKVHTEITPTDVELAEVVGFSDITLDHLKTFQILQASGLKCELQFIEFILAKSSVMKKCLIRPNSELVGEKGWKFFKELSRFRRASPQVEIVYED